MTDIQQVIPSARSSGRGFHAYSAKHLDTRVQRAGLGSDERLAVRAVAKVLPFRAKAYVGENLIDWDAAPDDPIYRLVFPQPAMLPAADVQRLVGLISSGAPEARTTPNCFRWAQFVDEPDLKMATDNIGTLVAYLAEHQEVISVLITGGDPMILGEPVLRRYIVPLLDPRLDRLESIRIGTKPLGYWFQQ